MEVNGMEWDEIEGFAKINEESNKATSLAINLHQAESSHAKSSEVK
jgi:hypothetical protein